MEFLFGMGVGVLIGWVIFEKPGWMKKGAGWVKDKFNRGKLK